MNAWPILVFAGMLLVVADPAHADGLAVVSRSDNLIAFIELETGEITSTLPTGRNPHEIIVSSDRRVAFVPPYGGNRVSSIDLDTKRLINQFEIADHRAMHAGAWLNDSVWITAEGKGVLLELDPNTGKVIAEVPTGGERSHMVIAVPSLNRLYVANMGSATVSVIDAESHSLRLIPVGGGPEGIDATPDGQQVWVSNREDNTVSVISTDTDEVIHTFPSHGNFPVKLRVRPDGREAWVVNNRSGSVAVFDAESMQHTGSIDVGSRPLGIVFADDSSKAFVSRPTASLVLEIDTSDLQVIRTLQAPNSPDGMVYLSIPSGN